MAINLEQFHQVFYEESFEGLDVMESSLMELNPDEVDSETINAIFRAAHSIKGGSATFGFTCIAEFTHDLETILDQVRNGERQVSAKDIDVFLQSVDCMREMLEMLKGGEDKYTDQSAALKSVFSNMLSKDSSTSNVAQVEQVAAEEALEKVWQIGFMPNKEILKTGNEVTRIFAELDRIGRITKVVCENDLPPLNALDPESCFLRWQLTLQSSAEKSAIEEVFDWVSDESDISISESPLDLATPNDAESLEGRTILFTPNEGILRTGNDVLRLFMSLSEMGDIQVSCVHDKLPDLNSMTAELCYLSWRIDLIGSDIDNDAIRKEFEWVLDEADLSIAPLSPQKNARMSEGDKAQQTPAVEKLLPPSAAVPQSSSVTPAPARNGKKESKEASAPAQKSTSEASIRVGIDKVDNLINMVGELVITQSMLGELGTDFDANRLPKLLEGLNQLAQNTRELQESVMRIRMLPISFAFSRFPRMIRDLGQKLEKKIRLKLLGENTELDKTVMEKIGDPLVHLVRNAVDHGIEKPEERLANDKPEEGLIILEAYHQGGNVVIEIKDDGKGLDRDKIIAKAIERNIISTLDAETMSDEQVFDLIFQPGFSTANQVSDVSGRGVGMDVVKRNIQALNGNVEIRSKKSQGSTITIRLPLTLAILDGQLVRVGSNTYIFPLVSIIESMQVKSEVISDIAGGCSVFRLRDDYVPIIELHRTFSVSPDAENLSQSLLVVVEYEGEKVGVVVDELMAQQQVVIKSLEQNYKPVDGISGATILGDGTVALIIDIGGIVKLAGAKFIKQDRVNSFDLAKLNNQSSPAVAGV